MRRSAFSSSLADCEAMQRIGPAVMGQLIAGMVLGPSVLGALWPDLQHAIFPRNAEQKSIGILMLLLLTGMETDLNLVKRVGRAECKNCYARRRCGPLRRRSWWTAGTSSSLRQRHALVAAIAP